MYELRPLGRQAGGGAAAAGAGRPAARDRVAAGDVADYHLYVLLAPHLNNRGAGNTAWVGDYKGVPMLFAERNGYALALACSAPWLARSVGFVGFSDGWQELRAHGRLRDVYERAENGNVALTGEIDLGASAANSCSPWASARRRPRPASTRVASLIDGIRRGEAPNTWTVGREWQRFAERRRHPAMPTPTLVDFSAAVLRVHESKHFARRRDRQPLDSVGLREGRRRPGRLSSRVAARPGRDGRRLSGRRRASTTRGASCATCRSRRKPTATGRQNMWLDGTPYWNGIQMDEAALPILLVDLARARGALGRREREPSGRWCSARRAISCATVPSARRIAGKKNPGYSPFTLGAEIAALLVAADYADGMRRAGMAAYLRETADAWNASLEDWIYVTGTSLAPDSAAWMATTSAWRNRTRPTRRRRSTASCRSRTGRPRRATAQRPRSWSARTRSRSSASACAPPTTRAS